MKWSLSIIGLLGLFMGESFAQSAVTIEYKNLHKASALVQFAGVQSGNTTRVATEKEALTLCNSELREARQKLLAEGKTVVDYTDCFYWEPKVLGTKFYTGNFNFY
jgi:hypothetical protein